jgi:hypothetical protein
LLVRNKIQAAIHSKLVDYLIHDKIEAAVHFLVLNGEAFLPPILFNARQPIGNKMKPSRHHHIAKMAPNQLTSMSYVDEK